MKRTFKEDLKLADELTNLSRYCQHCGHTIVFNSYDPVKKLCYWCKRYTYKDKKSEFMDKLKKEVRK